MIRSFDIYRTWCATYKAIWDAHDAVSTRGFKTWALSRRAERLAVDVRESAELVREVLQAATAPRKIRRYVARA